jgi:hypothetical protein
VIAHGAIRRLRVNRTFRGEVVMGWKSVAWAACLLPVLAGCGSVHKLTTGTRPAPSRSASEHDPRAAWATVREQHPQRAFSEEFHDGFLAGYADYLDRGTAAQPPAVPPANYTRYKKYLTPEGDGLVRDYYLGFQYGIDAAIAGKRWTSSNVPVPLPNASLSVAEVPARAGAPHPVLSGYKYGDPKVKSTDHPTPGSPTLAGLNGTARSGPLPKPELPIIPPFNPDRPGGGKFAPLPVPSDPDRLPVPYPPLPLPAMKVNLPASSDAAPAPPAGTSVPAILGDIPVIPFRLTPAPVPQK